MQADQHHPPDLDEQLQDWLDGQLSGDESRKLQEHVTSCTVCQARIAVLEQLDRTLRASAPRVGLDESFDARLFARIAQVDESRRAAARRQAEEEFEQNLRVLSRGWRRALVFVIPGIIAAMAIAYLLGLWLGDAGLAMALQSAPGLDGEAAQGLRPVMMTLLGVGVGLGLARWLAKLAE
jgi:anti-sigma factor RsiW